MQESQASTMNMKKLTGKVALVTGGSRGIGANIARALAESGADVGISYVASADKANAVVTELQAKGVRAAAFRADQAVASQVVMATINSTLYTAFASSARRVLSSPQAQRRFNLAGGLSTSSSSRTRVPSNGASVVSATGGRAR